MRGLVVGARVLGFDPEKQSQGREGGVSQKRRRRASCFVVLVCVFLLLVVHAGMDLLSGSGKLVLSESELLILACRSFRSSLSDATRCT